MLRLVHSQTVQGALLIDDIDDGLPNKQVQRVGSNGDPQAYRRDGYANAPKQSCYIPRVDPLNSANPGFIDLDETERVTLSAHQGKIKGFQDAGLISIVSLVAADLEAPAITAAEIDNGASEDLTITGTSFLSVSPDTTMVTITGDIIGSPKTFTEDDFVSISDTEIVIDAANLMGLAAGDEVVVTADKQDSNGFLISEAAELGTWTSTSIVDSRSGFASLLPEFESLMAPEVEEPASLFLEFAPNAATGSIKVGAPVYLECTLSGTFVSGTLEATGSVGGFTLDVAASLSEEVLSGTVTITNGSHEEVRLFNATSGPDSVSIPTGYWVKEDGGNDANDGSSPDEALETIAGLPTLVSGDRIYLARGSRWRELLDTSDFNACHVINYGIGPRPVCDACDAIPAASWTKTPGRTNIYQTTVTGENTSVGGAAFSAIVLDTGWQLEPLQGADLAASLTLVDAQPGSYVVQSLAGGTPVTIYVHLYGATKVPSDDRVEISLRPSGVRTLGPARIEGVLCRAGWSASGSLVLIASGAAIDNAYVDDCVALHGNDHNLFFPGGELHRTVCLGMNSGPNSNAQFVAFRSTIDPAATMLLHELACIQFPQLPNTTVVNTYTAHSGVSGNWMDVTLSRCYSYNASGWSVHFGLIDECLFERPRGSGAVIGVLTVAGDLTIRNTRVLGVTGGTGVNSPTIQLGAGTLVVENFVSWRPGDTLLGGHLLLRGTTATITNSHFSASATDIAADDTTGVSLSLSRVSCPRGVRFNLSGSALTPVNFIACLATSDWQEISTRSARDFDPNYTGDNEFNDCDTYTTTLPVYETEANPDRPIFLETAASYAARGWDIGPIQTKPGSGVSWVTPEIGPAWRTFAEGLSGPPT